MTPFAVVGGPVDTDSLAHLPDAEQWKAEVARMTPLQRLGQPDDIAGAVALLCPPEAAWITGQVLVADGGLSCL